MSLFLIIVTGAAFLFGIWLGYSLDLILFVLMLYWAFSGIITTFTRTSRPEHFESFM